MGHWNYRAAKHKSKVTDEVWISIHEVYYLDDGSIHSWSEEAQAAYGETVEELLADLERMRAAVMDKPVLDESCLLGYKGLTL